jgi:hypothetical protein
MTSVLETTWPRIVQLAPERVAVVRTYGDPAVVGPAALSALDAVVSLVRAYDGAFVPGPVRVRWPNAYLQPREYWTGLWATPVPADTPYSWSLSQVSSDVSVQLQTWVYAEKVMEVHREGGSLSDEAAQEALFQLELEDDYTLEGPYEEVYLTPFGSANQSVIVRHALRPRHPRFPRRT